MPNINFDIFFDENTLNFTASRGTKAPKVKPAWKVRNAPKLPPKEPPQPAAAKAFGPKTASSQAASAASSASTTSSQAPKRKPPKLAVKNKPVPSVSSN